MATEHCGHCGSQLCGHGACPECNPCGHCTGGDRGNKHFDDEYDDDEREMREEHLRERSTTPGSARWRSVSSSRRRLCSWGGSHDPRSPLRPMPRAPVDLGHRPLCLPALHPCPGRRERY